MRPASPERPARATRPGGGTRGTRRSLRSSAAQGGGTGLGPGVHPWGVHALTIGSRRRARLRGQPGRVVGDHPRACRRGAHPARGLPHRHGGDDPPGSRGPSSTCDAVREAYDVVAVPRWRRHAERGRGVGWPGPPWPWRRCPAGPRTCSPAPSGSPYGPEGRRPPAGGVAPTWSPPPGIGLGAAVSPMQVERPFRSISASASTPSIIRRMEAQ